MAEPDFLDSLNLDTPDDGAQEAEETVTDRDDDEQEREEPEQKAEKVVDVPSETTSEDESKESAGIKAGLVAERKKRQALEARLKEIEDRERAQQQKAPQTKFFEDPEKYIQERLSEQEARRNAALEDDMRLQHEDFDEVAQFAVDTARHNPALVQRVQAAANPARELYKLGKELQEAEKLKDPEAYKASIRDELKAELLAELKKELGGTPAKAKPALPKDLSNGRSGIDAVTTTPADPRKGDFAGFFDNK